jgi:predicted DNA-binding ribbon-helix-helix protein
MMYERNITMATLTIRMPEDRVNRLKEMAKSRGMSVNKLIEEWATMGIAEFDAHASFLARAARGSRERGLAALRELDRRDQTGVYGFHDQPQAPFEGKK